MSKRWKVSNTSVYNVSYHLISYHLISYHLIWCPKYRRKVLRDEVEERLRELLNPKADELEVEIESLEVMPDHVHCQTMYTYS
jgi:putative transposase